MSKMAAKLRRLSLRPIDLKAEGLSLRLAAFDGLQRLARSKQTSNAFLGESSPISNGLKQKKATRKYKS